jgi:hypothetical protein
VLKNVGEITIDGYASGETDFATRLSNSPPEVQDEFNLTVVSPLLAVLASSDQTAVLIIQGHSDRVDTPGLSREQCRLQELQASIDRANSATHGVFQIIASKVPDPQSFPTDWADLNQVVVSPKAAGAAMLVNSDASLSEEQRKRNRRVAFTLVTFLP